MEPKSDLPNSPRRQLDSVSSASCCASLAPLDKLSFGTSTGKGTSHWRDVEVVVLWEESNHQWFEPGTGTYTHKIVDLPAPSIGGANGCPYTT